ncbi:hypothetical protein H8S10_15015 [Clostridium sp. NSJ-49]|uniref:hypothetical protein n=1 Tax=Clostridium TaxID=1485 RepID=UPI00164A2015|nr:hypothetical protein [Clostridium sp. NSJ-49]MBC5626751.1 hypothetical protein [Clostridium sp. NSJ-49]
MEFITVEQFLEQPEEVQETFLDWWECKPFDIYAWFWDFPEHLNIESCVNKIQADSINRGKTINKGKAIDDIIPLFTEGQLRRFIEESTYTKIIVNKSDDKQYIIALILDNDEVYNMVDTETDDLLQAYWKVACMIAKEELDG